MARDSEKLIQLTRWESKYINIETASGKLTCGEWCNREVDRLIELGRKAEIRENDAYLISIWADEPPERPKEVKTSCYRPLTGYMPIADNKRKKMS